MPDSRVAALLRSYGVGTDLSVRKAAQRCGLSPQTVSKLMQGEILRLRSSTLAKVATGLGIPRDLLERASLADAGYVQAGTGSSVAEALEHLQGLSDLDLVTVRLALDQMQQARTTGQEMRDSAT